MEILKYYTGLFLLVRKSWLSTSRVIYGQQKNNYLETQSRFFSNVI